MCFCARFCYKVLADQLFWDGIPRRWKSHFQVPIMHFWSMIWWQIWQVIKERYIFLDIVASVLQYVTKYCSAEKKSIGHLISYVVLPATKCRKRTVTVQLAIQWTLRVLNGTDVQADRSSDCCTRCYGNVLPSNKCRMRPLIALVPHVYGVHQYSEKSGIRRWRLYFCYQKMSILIDTDTNLDKIVYIGYPWKSV